MKTATINTPLGNATLEGDEHGVQSFKLGGDLCTPEHLIPEELKATITQLNEYFKGERREFTITLTPNGTPFQQKVWSLLQQQPYGKTTSYLDLSKQLGEPKAIRAVANANGKNPIWILIPCHRIIGSNGALTGYAWGVGRKQWLLNHESPAKQQSLF